MSKEKLISLEEAERQLGITRSTLLYYLRKLDIVSQAFPLDRRKYLQHAGFEKIKHAKEGVANRNAHRNES